MTRNKKSIILVSILTAIAIAGFVIAGTLGQPAKAATAPTIPETYDIYLPNKIGTATLNGSTQKIEWQFTGWTIDSNGNRIVSFFVYQGYGNTPNFSYINLNYTKADGTTKFFSITTTTTNYSASGSFTVYANTQTNPSLPTIADFEYMQKNNIKCTFGVPAGQTLTIEYIYLSDVAQYQMILTNIADGLDTKSLFGSEQLYQGLQEEYAQTYTSAYLAGYDIGYANGAANTPGGNYQAGYEKGYSDGYDIGNTQGYQAGRNEALADPPETVTSLWYQQGYSVGYDKGYADGANSDVNLNSIILSIASVPVNMITEMFNVEVLGVNLSSIIFALLSAGLIVLLLRKLL